MHRHSPCTASQARGQYLPVSLVMAMQRWMCSTLTCTVLCTVWTTASAASIAERLDTVLSFAALGRYERHRKPESICESKRWRDQSLKLIKEVPFAGLFSDLHNESKFEASGLVLVNSTYFVVFDR